MRMFWQGVSHSKVVDQSTYAKYVTCLSAAKNPFLLLFMQVERC